MDNKMDCDVVVVGYGPSGLVMASALGRQGHRVVVVEKWKTLYGLPRLTHIDGETARIIQNVGDINTALRGSKPAAEYVWKNGDEKTLLTIDWSGESSGFAAHYTMYQPDIEDAIDESVKSHTNVTVMQGWSAVELSQDDEGVTLKIRPWSKDREDQWSQGEDERVIRAKYVIGADGSNSFVRTSLGIERDDLHSDDVWLNLDTEKLRELPERFSLSSQFCDPTRPNMFMPIGDKRHRFEVAVLPGDDLEEVQTEEYAWRWFKERHGLGPEDVKILRQVVYVFSARMADTWRVGRAFLVGDAAHTMPPYMGQGACSGMRDAYTLAWKLDMVLKGQAGDSLLDTYEPERRPHADAIRRQSVELGKVANMLDPVAAEQRDRAFWDGQVPSPPPFPIIENGLLSAESPSFAGTLSPQGVVTYNGKTGLFDEVVGGGFSLVTTVDPREVLSEEQLKALLDIGVSIATLAENTQWSIVDEEGTYRQFVDETNADAYLARPDFALFGTSSAQGLAGLVSELLSQLERTKSQSAMLSSAS